MSYTPDDQNLDSFQSDFDKLTEEFHQIVYARRRSGDWKDDHIDELNDLFAEIHKLNSKIQRI